MAFSFISGLFKKNSKEKLESVVYAPKFRVVVAEFVDNIESNIGEVITKELFKKEGLEVMYYDEPFNKNFLNLDSKELFDWIDKGQSIIDEYNADVVVWGYRENNKLRLNFQSGNQYAGSKQNFISLMDSLYVPTFKDSSEEKLPTAMIDLIHGAVISTAEPVNKEMQVYRKYILRKIIDKLIKDDSAKNLSAEFMPYIINFLGIAYLSYAWDSKDNKDFKVIKNLFETAIINQELISNPIHLGCIYYHLGQLYDSAANNIVKNSSSYFKGAIEYYVQAQKYLNRFNYPYEYGGICYRLSLLYFNYWKQKADLQALRDAVSQLREAEKVYTYALFPDFWAHIQDNLGYLLSLLGNITNSIEIGKLAITSYQNRQQVITEKKDPVSWATTQDNIADIYYKMGKSKDDVSFLEESLEYYHDALYVFENAQMEDMVKKLNISIAKVSQILNS